MMFCSFFSSTEIYGSRKESEVLELEGFSWESDASFGASVTASSDAFNFDGYGGNQ